MRTRFRPLGFGTCLVVTSLLGLVAGLLSGVALSQPAGATTLTDLLNDTPRNNVRYCIPTGENPPGITLTKARALLDNAIAHWETPTSPGSGDAVNLSRGCGDPDVTIKSENIGPVSQVVAPANEVIQINENDSWWDGVGQRGANEYSFEGVLVHEIGHTLGLGHVGATDLNTCGDQGTTWKKCGGGIEIDNNPTTKTATVFRAYVQSTSNGDLYIDKAGSHGGTTP